MVGLGLEGLSFLLLRYVVSIAPYFFRTLIHYELWALSETTLTYLIENLQVVDSIDYGIDFDELKFGKGILNNLEKKMLNTAFRKWKWQ